jgi:hypothetical protein
VGVVVIEQCERIQTTAADSDDERKYPCSAVVQNVI